MSMMNAITGSRRAMKLKFCSGPTPMYTPPAAPSNWMLWAKSASLETRLSEWLNSPGASDSVVLNRQNSSLASDVGNVDDSGRDAHAA
jgi:hypothetical protein